MVMKKMNLSGRFLLLCCVFVLSGWGAPHAVYASTFSVAPVRIFLQPRDKATAITVFNEGDSEVVLQADVYQWRQLAKGEDDVQLSEDLIVSPPIIKLAPGAKQVVRLARLSLAPPAEQQTYRLIVREVAEIAAVKPASVNVQIALALSMPVFITPANSKSDMHCSIPVAENGPDAKTLMPPASPNTGALKFVCKNEGNGHAQIRHAWVVQQGKVIANLDNGGYFLAGTQRMLSLPRFEGDLNDKMRSSVVGKSLAGSTRPSQGRELHLSLDDGSEPIFPLAN